MRPAAQSKSAAPRRRPTTRASLASVSSLTSVRASRPSRHGSDVKSAALAKGNRLGRRQDSAALPREAAVIDITEAALGPPSRMIAAHGVGGRETRTT